jgi:hypothetical protein
MKENPDVLPVLEQELPTRASGPRALAVGMAAVSDQGPHMREIYGLLLIYVIAPLVSVCFLVLALL